MPTKTHSFLLIHKITAIKQIIQATNTMLSVVVNGSLTQSTQGFALFAADNIMMVAAAAIIIPKKK